MAYFNALVQGAYKGLCTSACTARVSDRRRLRTRRWTASTGLRALIYIYIYIYITTGGGVQGCGQRRLALGLLPPRHRLPRRGPHRRQMTRPGRVDLRRAAGGARPGRLFEERSRRSRRRRRRRRRRRGYTGFAAATAGSLMPRRILGSGSAHVREGEGEREGERKGGRVPRLVAVSQVAVSQWREEWRRASNAVSQRLRAAPWAVPRLMSDGQWRRASGP